MRFRSLALALALAAPATILSAQTGPGDWRTAPPMPGSWAYREVPDGSEAVFTDAQVIRRVVVKCSRAARRVAISVTSSTPAAAMTIFTSDVERALPSTFTAQGFQITAELGAQDPILDGIAMSRGRFSIAVPGAAALVFPAWPEIARSIEDCRL
jgi:hypothetical protein